MGMRVFGVDAGGSVTRAAVWDVATDEQWEAEAGPGNPFSAGPLAAAAEIERACAEALALAGTHPHELGAAVIGIAGNGRVALSPEFLQTVENWGLSSRLRLTSDLELAATAGLGTGPGVHVIAGTGSAVFTRTASGAVTETGGWGWFLGDPGSGFDLGTRALRWWCQWQDGVVGDDGLGGVLQAATGMEAPVEALAFLRDPARERPWIAGIAHPLLEAAAAGVPTARRVVEASVAELAGAVLSAMEPLAAEKAVRLSGSGGLFASSFFRDTLVRMIESARPQVEWAVKSVDPLRGALTLARELVRPRG